MSIGLRAARGAAWTILSSLGSRGIGLISTIVLTRFLEKAEYGAVMVAITLVLTAEEFSHFGLFQYVVAKPRAGRAMVFHATFYHLLIGLLVLSGVFVLREPLAAWFSGDPTDAIERAAAAAASSFVLVTCISSALDRVAVPPERVLARDLRFGTIAGARFSTETLYALVAVTLGIIGFGGYAIVYGNIAQWGVYMLWLVWVCPWREWIEPHRITWPQTRELWGFGLPLAAAAAASFASRMWDKLLISRLFGLEVIGRYNLAYNLADIPATHVGENISDVLFPSFARMDPETRNDALVRGIALLSLVTCPMAIGLMAVAPTVTTTVFDPRWVTMAPMLAILSALSIVRPVGFTVDSFLKVIDRPKTIMVLAVLKVALLLGSIYLLSPWGELWACAAVGLAHALHAALSVAVVRGAVGIPLWQIPAGVAGPVLACVPLVGAVYGARYLLAKVGLDGGAVALIVEIAAGGLAYLPAVFVCAPATSRNFIGLLRKIVIERRGGGDDDDDDGDDDDG